MVPYTGCDVFTLPSHLISYSLLELIYVLPTMCPCLVFTDYSCLAIITSQICLFDLDNFLAIAAI